MLLVIMHQIVQIGSILVLSKAKNNASSLVKATRIVNLGCGRLCSMRRTKTLVWAEKIACIALIRRLTTTHTNKDGILDACRMWFHWTAEMGGQAVVQLARHLLSDQVQQVQHKQHCAIVFVTGCLVTVSVWQLHSSGQSSWLCT